MANYLKEMTKGKGSTRKVRSAEMDDQSDATMLEKREKAQKLPEKRGPAMDRHNLWHQIDQISLAIFTL